MSRESVEWIRRNFDLFNGREIDAWAETLAPDVEWHVDPQDPETTVHRGRDAARRYVLSWVETMDVSQEVLEMFDGGDQVVAWVHISGRGGASGTPVGLHLAYIFTLRDGVVIRIKETQDKAEALEAVGLRE